MAPRPLRKWQVRAWELLEPWLFGHDADPQFIEAATGAGKTRLLSHICQELFPTLAKNEVIVISTSREGLVFDISESVTEYVGKAHIGQWFGGKKRIRPVTVCCDDSLPTLVEALKHRGLRCVLLIVDEAHGSEAPVYMQGILDLEAMSAGGVNEAGEEIEGWTFRRLGLSATPFRGKKLSDKRAKEMGVTHETLTLWPNLLFRYPRSEALKDGVIVEHRSVFWPDEIDDINEAVLTMLRKHGPDTIGPALVTATDVDDGVAFAEWLAERTGWRVRCVSYRDKREDVRRIIRETSEGFWDVLVSVRLLTEGWDVPPLRVLCLRVPIGKDGGLMLVQAVGRVIRSLNAGDFLGQIAKYGAKTCAYVLDPLRALFRHDLEVGASLGDLGINEEKKALDAPVPGPPKEQEEKTILAQTTTEWEAWAYQLRAAAQQDGLVGAVNRSQAEEPTASEFRELRRCIRTHSIQGVLPKKHQLALAYAVSQPTLLTRGIAQDLLAVLNGCQKRSAYWFSLPGPHNRGLTTAQRDERVRWLAADRVAIPSLVQAAEVFGDDPVVVIRSAMGVRVTAEDVGAVGSGVTS
jgi:superfamily II DNA or RNA helicase